MMENIKYEIYKNETQMDRIKYLMDLDLSEPYSIYTYRYFMNHFPNHTILAVDTEKDNLIIGAIVSKLDTHKDKSRGYIAMYFFFYLFFRLAVDQSYRKRGIGKKLIHLAIEAMMKENADEVVLETETFNTAALYLYESLGFFRDKKLHKYYLR
jgi:N-alpha-acetyltransferase 30